MSPKAVHGSNPAFVEPAEPETVELTAGEGALPDCPTCARRVAYLHGTTPYDPDIEPLAKQATAARTGLMEFHAVPCGHRVEVIAHNGGGRMELAEVRP
jgi:hypothetical protein